MEEKKKAVVQMQPITDTLEKNFMPYAMSVIVSRAIPEIDGFKPSHRKILYTMYKMGLMGSHRSKSANVVGQTMKLNPHGDQAIYETLVRLTRGNSALLHPYIDSKGNFGRQYSRDMQYAAARYTEVRLDAICQEIFSGLDRDSVDFIDNYDGTMQEPTLLPASFPSILVNSNQGIAVGIASNICSFNLTEVCRAAIAMIHDATCHLADYIPAPDFTTGGEIVREQKVMDQIYQNGRGSVKVRGICKIDRKNNLVEIVEIPYTTTVEAIIDDVTNLVRQGKIKEINDIRDETDLSGLKITVEYKRNTDPDALVQKLFRFTSLQSTFACNFNVLINGYPRLLGVRGILAEWLVWRRSCLQREFSYELGQKQDRLHLLRGLETILLDIDKAIHIIRETEKESDVIPNLMEGFSIDALQADYIADIRLRQLNRQYILQRVADIERLVDEISELEAILSDRSRIDDTIISQLEAVIKKYGQPRISRVVDEEDVEQMTEIEMIDDFRLRLFLTEHGYLKKLALTSLRSAGELKTKDDDQIMQDLEGHNKSDVLCFSNRGNVYKIKAHDIPDHKPSDLGEYTPNLLELEQDELIVFIHITDDDYAGQLLFGFANGKVARVPLDAYQTKTNRRRLVNAYNTVSPLVAIHYLAPEAEDEFLAASQAGKVLVFDSRLVPLKATRSNQGVKVMTVRKGDSMARLVRLADSELADGKGYRKRKIPAVGSYIRDDDLAERQIGLEET